MVFAAVKTIALCCLAVGLCARANGKSLTEANAVDTPSVASEEAEAKRYVAELNARLEVLNTAQVDVTWKFNTDITSENEANLVCANVVAC